MIDTRADAIFLLAERPRAAVVPLELEGWREGLLAQGIECLDPERAPSGANELVIGQAGANPELRDAGAVLLEGRPPRRRLRAAGFVASAYLPLPSPGAALMLLPVGDSTRSRYALERTPPSSLAKRLRNRLVVGALGLGVAPRGRAAITVGTRRGGAPFLVREAAALGVPDDVGALLMPAQGDALSRGTLALFRRSESTPSWVIKFARVPGYAAAFDRDQRGLELVARRSPTAARHAPRVLGRLAHAGLHASLETAALGRPLVSLLSSTGSRSAKLETVERIAAWVVTVSRESLAGGEALAPELASLRTALAPAAPALAAELLDRLPGLCGVLAHNDLGTWNVIVGPRSAPAQFTVLDWEDARAVGPPLWDLWYFLLHALGEVDGVCGLDQPSLAARERHAVALFRGELELSEVLFRWTRAAVAEARVPGGAVGALATLCFIFHGRSQGDRQRELDRRDTGERAIEMLPTRFAKRWLSEPGLGPEWEAWRRG